MEGAEGDPRFRNDSPKDFPLSADSEIIPVPASMLASGNWETGNCKDEGAIYASYSADRISEGKPIRQPFRHKGELWITVGMSGAGGIEEARVYRLTPAVLFKGEPTTYSKKVSGDCGEAARNDPKGFYDNMKVVCGRETFVLTGPEVRFIPDPTRPEEATAPESAQLSLF